MNRYTFNISLDCNVRVDATSTEAARVMLFRALEDAFLCCVVAEGDEDGNGRVTVIDAGTIEGEPLPLLSTETI